MASYNKIALIGNLGRDPEIREFQGRKVANFSLAVNERYTKSDGKLIERTEWFRISFWGNIADVAEKYLHKGDQVMVEGRLSTREYQDKDGINRTALEVSGQNLVLLGNSQGGDSSSAPRSSAPNAEDSGYSSTAEDNFPTDQGMMIFRSNSIG
ncbi:MAG: single-stranded DNA-binding protein [Bacteroidia bacterium]|nr:single-stranded DNA-binding protein [Bacteroidia bacterium]